MMVRWVEAPKFCILNNGYSKFGIQSGGQLYLNKRLGMVAHPELAPEMLGKESYCVFVFYAVLLQQVAHGFHNQPLAFDVPWIC